MTITGTYPMLYAFFGPDGALSRDAFSRQVSAAEAAGADGIAVLGLGTEGAKLGREERRSVIRWVMADAGGRLPVAVTIAGDNLPDMTEAARYAEGAGAAWLILQPPRPPCSAPDLITWFATIAGAVTCPVAIQNAPEFLGIGLGADDLIALHDRQSNITAVKAESSALTVGNLVDRLDGRMTVLNGRAGLELTDNYRAGVAGMIPGIETIDHQVAIARAMRAGRLDEAEAAYRRLLPAIAFIMQGVAQFVLYGKIIAALRLGLEISANRLPSDTATPSGLDWAGRYARDLGPLPS